MGNSNPRVPIPSRRVLPAVLVWLLTIPGGMAQIPEPRIYAAFPAGAKAGVSGLEISVSGENLDDPLALVFSHPGITAKLVSSEPTPLSGRTWPLPNRYRVEVRSDVPPGYHEVRFKGRFGLSNACAFAVGWREELLENESNHSAETAMALAPGSVVNGKADGQRADYFRISGKAGETLHIACDAGVIDSRMSPWMVLFDGTGTHQLHSEPESVQRNGRIDYGVPLDGEYIVRVSDGNCRSGGEFFYRLYLDSENLPPKVIDTAGLPMVEATAITEGEKAKSLSPPCVVSGTWKADGARERFSFEAEKGKSYAIEVISERVGFPTDPMMKIAKLEGGEGKVTVIGSYDDGGEAGGRWRLPLGTRDCATILAADADATYQLSIGNQFGSVDGQSPYWLRVSEPHPDFELIAVATNPVEDGKKIGSGLTVLRSGGTLGYEVHVLRRDGLDGEIGLRCEGLPAGVTVENGVIPAGRSETTLLLRVGEVTERWDGVFQIVGKGAPGEHEARALRLRLPVNDYDRDEVDYVAASGFALTLLPEPSPLGITIKPDFVPAFESSLGGVVEIPVSLERTGTFKGNVRIRPIGIAGVNQPPELNLDEKTGEGVLSIPLVNRDNNRYEPGTLVFHLFAEGTVSLEPNVEAKGLAEEDKGAAEKQANELAEQAKADPGNTELAERARKAAEEKNIFLERARQATERAKARDVKVYAHSRALTLQLAGSPVQFGTVSVPDRIEAGSGGILKLAIERYYGFAEEVRIEAVLPEATSKALGMNAVLVAKDQTEAEMVVTALPEAAAGTYPLQLKAKVKFNGIDLETTRDVVVLVGAAASE